MQTKKSVKPEDILTWEKPDLRQWLMEGGEFDSRVEDGLDTPLLLWFLKNQAFELAQELLSAGADVHAQDNQGRHWLHHAILAEAPLILVLQGFRKMDARWWQADEAGHTPLHLPIHDTRVAQALITRWWAERRAWHALTQPFDPLQAQLPQTAAWQAWQAHSRVGP